MKTYYLSFINDATNFIKRITVNAMSLLEAIETAEQENNLCGYSFLCWD